MKKLFSILVLAAIFFSGFAFATQSLKAQVNGMVRALGQTKDVYVNLKQKVVVVELKDGQSLTHEAFAMLIKDAGYDVTAAETVEKSARDIKAEMCK